MPAPVSGGWMYSLADQLTTKANIKLAVATIYSGNTVKTFNHNGVIYYLLPCANKIKYSKELEPIWGEICLDFKPDVIHIHGTEFPHGLACMRAHPTLNYIVSIQGLVSIIARYYYAGLPFKELLMTITFRDIIRFDTIFQAKKKFIARGIIEKEYIQRTKNIIGRTNWDYAHINAINPAANYHYCNETLRDSFYTSNKWDINNKTDYTIFLSQASYPIKGFHQVLKAVVLLKKDYPLIKVRIAGGSIINTVTWIDKIKLGGYGSYIKKLIHQLDLHEQVIFTGTLNEVEMINEYLNAHIFICPSSIENSPNSLGEAQLLGVPVIASYVGGIPDFITHGETGFLYRFEEVEILADTINKIFLNTYPINTISKNEINLAEYRHSVTRNLNTLLNIYCKYAKPKVHLNR
jgi:glycosyltransferase involved in cell wall biosynthesis